MNPRAIPQKIYDRCKNNPVIVEVDYSSFDASTSSFFHDVEELVFK